jgi:CotH kinase protein/Lamin Tail Domain/Bacterial TSP3 repeat
MGAWPAISSSNSLSPAKALFRRWGYALTLIGTALSLPAQIVINEIHFDPDVKTEPVEFIELFNHGSNLVNLSGWQLTDAVSFTIPNGTVLNAGGYLVIGQNPTALQTKFGVLALGPWIGQLNNEGEKVTLNNASGGKEDEVNFQLGFPWPTVGDSPGYSIELANPAFDNDLGGNWRGGPSSPVAGSGSQLISSGSVWRYFKGVSEASSPTTAWRSLGFDDSFWSAGATPTGYDPTVPIATYLSDMLESYTTVFLRQQFAVTNAAQIKSLSLESLYDDGFKVWINGQPVLDANMASGEVPAVGTASVTRENGAYATFNLPSPQNYLVTGTNVIAVQAANVSISDSADFFLDLRLVAGFGSPNGPTPGALNAAFTSNLPPQIRQVNHSPEQPPPGNAVIITAKVTDPENVGAVLLQYQIVSPGSYIELADAAYSNNWITVVMNDSGSNGDALAGDSVFTGTIPGSVQQNRRLIRYVLSATDGTGRSITAPYADDPQPNFAYFCYGGVPAWQGAVQPGVTPLLDFDTNVMRRLPTVHLISKNNSVVNATWFSRYGGDLYLWSGALVYDGKVYDHIHSRARGGVHRYEFVKNMWKFDLNRGHDFQMRDDYGRKYDTLWKKLNLGSCIQNGYYGCRGEQGLFESVGFRLFNLVGVESPNTTFMQFRVVDAAAETTPDQYEGDFWGLYLAIEQEDRRFLEEHELPDGNLYKMEYGTGELNNLGPLGPVDKSDLNTFLSTYNGSVPADNWWRTNLDLPRYYSYRTIVEGIHHYDIGAGKNYFYYRNPESWLWSVHTWDLDLTWADNMYGDGAEPFKSRVLTKAALNLEYKNRIREIRDLLFNTNQAWQLIEECAGLVRGPTNGPTFVDADRCMWDYNPKMASSVYSANVYGAGQGKFYQFPYQPTVSKDFKGGIQLMKNYIVSRGTFLDNLAVDAAIPVQPTVSYIGTNNFPLSGLSFRSSAYAGGAAFAAMKWRVGEVLDTNAPAYNPAQPQPYEITAQWESPEITNFNRDITIPIGALKSGHAYRVRVRMKDVSGRWSKWSAPVQFISTPPENSAALVSYLRISELMYNPSAGNDYEFIELHNTSTNLSLDLGGAAFTAGVSFTFPGGTTLVPDGYLLVIRNPNAAAFRFYYGLATNIAVAGPYSGSLANDGEQLTLKTAAGGSEISAFEFNDARGWPLAAAGPGHSLVPVAPDAPGQATGALDYPGNWRASVYRNGSPGQADPAPPAATLLLNEIVAHTDYFDPLRPEYDSDDWIELYNCTSTNLTLTGWYLSDDPSNPSKWAIPSTIVPARSWIAFSEVNDFHNPIHTGFGLDKAGEQVLLSHLPGTAADRVVDAVMFKGQANEVSLARYADGAPFWCATARTRSAANTPPLPGLRFTEIMYHPPDLGTNDNVRDEFIELLNPTASPIALHDTNGAWRLDGGISFTFQTNTVIAADETLLVVSFAPTNSAASNTFRIAYGFTNASLPLAGPYTGKLGNRSDRVALDRPQLPDAPGDAYSWVIVDEVIYGNQNPWPTSANGFGSALHRRSVNRNGNDPENWYAAPATPGNAQVDNDGDGLPNDWEADHSLNPNDPGDAALDSDGDGLTNYQEFLCGSDPWHPASVFRFDSIITSNGVVQLLFTAMADRSYSIQFRNSLDAGSWQNLTNLSAAAITRALVIPGFSTDGADARFYRLVTPAMP